jgi:Protein of unknown function (DUF2723)
MAVTRPTGRSFGRLGERVAGTPPGSLAAAVVFAIALAVYLRTLVPGPTFGDWAEMQFIPAQLGIPHPTGYPLYVLVGKAFSLLPIGSVAYRAELLSAVAAAAAAATAVLISWRLGVRPVLAIAAGLSLAVTGTLWLEATYSEMNGLHLLLVAALIHRALVWRAERRDRDLLIGALLAGLALSNHLLAITVVPIIVLFVLVDARARLVERPVLLLQAALLGLIGLTPYLFIPLRALAGPAAIYGRFLTWEGFASLVSGADFRGDMHFTSGESVVAAWQAIPDVVAQFEERSHPVFVYGALLGAAVLFVRNAWVGLLFTAIVAANVFFYANYVGDLEHYLLVTWLVCSVWLAVLADWIVTRLERALPAAAEAPGPAVIALVLPVIMLINHWTTYDQSRNDSGERFARSVFRALPPDAVLLSYWDSLTNLSYVHCIEGVRADVRLRAFDTAARILCDPVEGSLQEVAGHRPLFALFAIESELNPLRESFDFVPGPSFALSYGRRELDHTGTLYRLVPKPGP